MHLLITSGTAAADRAKTRRHAERTHIDLDTASIAQLTNHHSDNHDSLTVIVSTWAALRRAAVPLRLVGATADVTIRVLDEMTPRGFLPAVWPGFQGRLLDLSSRSQRNGGTTVHIRLSKPAPVHHVVGHQVHREPGVLMPPLRLALADRTVEPYAVGLTHVRYAHVDDVAHGEAGDVPLTEVVLTPALVGDNTAADPRAWVSVGHQAAVGEPYLSAVFPPVDTAVVNPTGFENAATEAVGRAAPAEGGAVRIVDDQGRVRLHAAAGAPLSRAQVEQVRSCQYVDVRAAGSLAEHAFLLVQLAAAGVPLVVPSLEASVQRALGPELSDVLARLSQEQLADPLGREAFSVRLRRAALRAHGLGPRLRDIGRRSGRAVAAEPPLSVILMTKRPHRVAQALQQLSRQTYPNVQVILGLHGGGFDQARIRCAIEELAVPCETVVVPEDVVFGEALNRATERCDGRLVTKVDDDDLYGTEHLWDLVLAADYSGATVVGKAAEFTLLSDLKTTIRRNSRHSEQFTWHVAGGTIMLRRETLQAMGGWRPQPRYVDDALLRQVRDWGGTVYRTQGFGYVLVRHGDGHTWEVGPEYFLSGLDRRWPSTSPFQDLALEQRWEQAQPVE